MKFIGTNEPRFDSNDLNDRVSFNRSNEPEFDKKNFGALFSFLFLIQSCVKKERDEFFIFLLYFEIFTHY